MANKTVLLPREWNDPGVPPENRTPVLVKFNNGYAIAYRDDRRIDGVFFDTLLAKPIPHQVLGWCAILQQ